MHQQPKYDTDYYVSLFQQGDERGLNFVFHKLYRLLVFYADGYVNNRALAEEIASGAFIKAWPQHHKMHHLSGIKAYLLKITERDCIRTVQREKKLYNIRMYPTSEEESDVVFQRLVKAETYSMLHEAIQKLSPGMRAVMESIYIEGNTLTETAKLLNLNTSTINTQKSRALQIIRKLIPNLG